MHHIRQNGGQAKIYDDDMKTTAYEIWLVVFFWNLGLPGLLLGLLQIIRMRVSIIFVSFVRFP